MADGDTLKAYQENARLHRLTSADGAREALVAAYFDDRYLHSTGSVLLLAHRRADVRYLNQRIRDARLRAGELGPGVRVAGSEFAAGDRILFTRNDHSGRYVHTDEQKRGIQNGTFGTITSAEPRRIRVRLDSGREVYFDPSSYDAIAHAYACSIHKAQGATADRTYVLASRGFDRNLTYVALTRHRESTLLFYDSETFPTPRRLLATFSRNPGKDLVRDYEGLHHRELAPNRVFHPEARFEALQQALAELDRWDGLISRSHDLAAERERLPQAGSIPDLMARKRSLAKERQALDTRLSKIYRHPRTARTALQRTRGDQVARALRENPARFGDLRGRQVLGTPTRQRHEALLAADKLADRLADLNARQEQTRSALASAQRLRRRAQQLDRELGSLGSDRDEILANLGRIAGPFKIEELEDKLSPRHLSIVRELRHAEKAYLSPLKAHLAATRRQQTHTRAARRLVERLVRQAPLHILRRLTPPELRLLLTAYRIAHTSILELDRAMRL